MTRSARHEHEVTAAVAEGAGPPPLRTRPLVGPRWPAWPSELAQLASTFEPDARRSEDERYAALIALDDYPTAAIDAVLALAIDDPASSVQRQAMGMCIARRIFACQPAAARVAKAAGAELSTRVRALELLALDATREEWSTILIAAIDDPLPGLQSAALGLVGLAPIAPSREAELSLRLRVKVGDSDPELRAAACRALGLRRDELSLPSLLRALDDPDPIVVEAAVEALAVMASPGSLAALSRTLDDATTPSLQRRSIVALAGLPGREAERALLDRLRPASDAQREWIVRAVASRREWSSDFLRDVGALLRDPELGASALTLLAELGVRAHPVVRDLLDAGVEPTLAGSLSDILARAQGMTVKVEASLFDAVPAPGLPARVACLAPSSGLQRGSEEGADAPLRERQEADGSHEYDRRWRRALLASSRLLTAGQRARLVADVDDALSRGLPASHWLEPLWTMLLASREQHRRRPARWTPFAASALEHILRDPGEARWLRCTAWAALSTMQPTRRQRARLHSFVRALASKTDDRALVSCSSHWPSR